MDSVKKLLSLLDPIGKLINLCQISDFSIAGVQLINIKLMMEFSNMIRLNIFPIESLFNY